MSFDISNALMTNNFFFILFSKLLLYLWLTDWSVLGLFIILKPIQMILEYLLYFEIHYGMNLKDGIAFLET